MGRKAGMYINSKKFGGVVKPCMLEMTAFLNCLALNKQIDQSNSISSDDYLSKSTRIVLSLYINIQEKGFSSGDNKLCQI
uniref:Uncharacterized protein n=1 Tax=Aegilops tauschii subsp. strangulata TaxID=200361 RepID=A0A453F8R9_AEGTS